jgi:hypothetical protein
MSGEPRRETSAVRPAVHRGAGRTAAKKTHTRQDMSQKRLPGSHPATHRDPGPGLALGAHAAVGEIVAVAAGALSGSAALANLPTVLVRPAQLPWTPGPPPPKEGQLGSAVTPPEGLDRSAAARDAVVAAFVLGWHAAELFHAEIPMRPASARAR